MESALQEICAAYVKKKLQTQIRIFSGQIMDAVSPPKKSNFFTLYGQPGWDFWQKADICTILKTINIDSTIFFFESLEYIIL